MAEERTCGLLDSKGSQQSSRLTQKRQLELRRLVDSGEPWIKKVSVPMDPGHVPVIQAEKAQYAENLQAKTCDEDVDTLLDLGGAY